MDYYWAVDVYCFMTACMVCVWSMFHLDPRQISTLIINSAVADRESINYLLPVNKVITENLQSKSALIMKWYQK